MQNQMVPTAKKEGIFFNFLLLMVFFVLLELSFFIQCNKTYLSSFTFVSDNIKIPATILPGIFYFLIAQLIVHVSFCLLAWLLTDLISRLLQINQQKKIILGIGIWTIGIVTALVANQYFFPNSKFAELTEIVFFNDAVTKVSLFLLLIIDVIIFFLAIIEIARILSRQPTFIFVLVVFFAGYCLYLNKNFSLSHQVATEKRPNIIIIGVDSLRPDFLSYNGGESATPFMDSFLNKAFVFSDSVTPLARTFPSWTGILTGEYPKNSGVRFNLPDQKQLNFSDSLPSLLQKNGYETIYASDETRFSNIDKNFGFNQIVTPPMGLNDFLLGTFNDFPLTNLLINTSIGKWLFPYSYANRPVYFAYDPNSFLNLVRPELIKSHAKPLFLAIHFCLPHYPYLWANLPGNDYSIQERYRASIVRVDRQLQDFFGILNQAHLLDHAMVILLSDHGEALEFNGDRITEKDLFVNKGQPIPAFYPPSLDKEEMNQSAGHGTDVLGLPQYHNVLGFRAYGLAKESVHQDFPSLVTLLDVKPTILDLLKLSAPQGDGQSLLALIEGKKMRLAKQHTFLESDFSPEAIRTVYPEAKQVLLEGIELFQVDPSTTRLSVKERMGAMIIHSKQYADIYGEWMLALYPESRDQRIPILVNLVSGNWTDDLTSKFAHSSPAERMLRALTHFYGKELSNNKFDNGAFVHKIS